MLILKLIMVFLSALEVDAAIANAGVKLDDDKRWRYASLISEAADEHGIDPMLVAAVMWNESDFRNLAVNKTRDFGLMQVHWQKMGRNEHWLRGLTKKDLMVPEINIAAGVQELAYWKKVCKGRGHTTKQHFWWSHYKWGNVVKSDRYQRRILRRYKKLNRSKHRETDAETPLRRRSPSRRQDEPRADRQMPRHEAGVSVVALH
jgi:hypothetical protein